MSVTFVVERSLTGQAGERRSFEAGEMVIGRGDDADWRIEDPEMFVSRRHAVISLKNDRPHITDMSRGGVFIDGADTPLGAGNSRALENGMRLRFGDVVICVEMDGAEKPERERPAPETGGYLFEPAEPEPEPEPRPSTLPEPFGARKDDARRKADENRPPPRPLDPEDPFALDSRQATPSAAPAPQRTGGYFDDEPEQEVRTSRDAAKEEETDYPGPWAGAFGEEPASRSAPDKSEKTPFSWEMDFAGPSSPAEPDEPRPGQRKADDEDLRAAFMRGMGLDPARFPTDNPAVEMEDMGRRFRGLVEGLMQLLRTRALEKQKVRVAQTVISSADVNPLKFLATTDDALGALVATKGAGYLGPDASIDAAFRDLADHQVRTWTALQSSLRHMIDQFDPARIEADMEAAGLLETLLAGGRHAKLWRLYQERYRDIAKTAEDRFLGEVGAEFRDAYEGYGRSK
jgi:type VI secretion system protein ImpI